MMSAAGLLMSRDLGPPQQAAAARILTSGTRIKGMVNDLLDFTRTRLGAGIPLACAEMDLGEVCRQVVEEAAAYHPDREVRFEAAGPERGSWRGWARWWRTWSGTPSSTGRRACPYR
jgi:signal transduction histidine kinase